MIAQKYKDSTESKLTIGNRYIFRPRLNNEQNWNVLSAIKGLDMLRC